MALQQPLPDQGGVFSTGDYNALVANITAVNTVLGVAAGAPTGTGTVVLATSPTLITPALGTPASGNLANCTGVTTSGIDPTLIQYVSVPLTLGQLQALNTAPVSVIAAQGAGTLIEVTSAVLELVYGSAAFTGGGTVQLSYGNATTYPASVTIAATVFTTFAANQAILFAGAMAVTATTNTLNKAIFLFGNTGNFAVGTGATGILKIAYRVHSNLS